jgi:outer membrane protein OmpA-like peptidoglycan-associated protein
MSDWYGFTLFPTTERGYIVRNRTVRDIGPFGLVEIDLGFGRKLRGRRRKLSRSEAERLLRSVCNDCQGQRAIYSLARESSPGPQTEDEAIDEAARLLASGRYVLVEHERPRRAHRTVSQRLDQDEPGSLTEAPRTDATALRVRVLLDDGIPLAGARVNLGAPDGQSAELDTSSSGAAELDDVAFDGVGRAVVLPAKVPRWRRDTEASQESEHAFEFPFDAPIAADIPTATTCTIVLRRPEVERIDGARLGFAPDSPLLVPLADDLAPLQALATALARLRDDPALHLLIVGHASADGSARTNDTLALQRAECARHLLLGDRDAWVELAAAHGSPADIQKLLRYLAAVHDWPTDPGRVDGVIDHTVDAAVSSFQATYNAIFGDQIMVDGVIGRETLGALFDVQRHELRHQLGALDVHDAPPRWFGAPGVASACARVLAHPGIPGSQTAAGQRRVDLLLLRDSLSWTPAHGLERLYDVARFPVVPIAPLPFGPSDLVLQVVDHYGRILAGEPYRLTTDEDERVGTSDEQGMVIERVVRGRNARLECGDAVIVIDESYYQVARQRYSRVPPADFGDADEDPWSDDPLPALDDEDENEDS